MKKTEEGKKEEVMLKENLYSLLKGLKMSKFEHPINTYAVNKNKRLIGYEIDDMETTVEQDKLMKEFTIKREELAKTHCKKDEVGELIIKRVPIGNDEFQQTYDVEGANDEKSVYRKELAKIQKEYKESIDKHEAKVKVFTEELLKKNAEVVLHKIKLDFLGKHEKCPQPVMDLIFWMIEEE